MVKDKTKLLFIFVFACFSINLYGQHDTSNVLKGTCLWLGGNTSAFLPQLMAQQAEAGTPSFGLELGLSYEIPIKQHWGLSFGLLLFQKGLYLQKWDSSGNPYITSSTLPHIGATVLGTYKWNKTMFSQAGLLVERGGDNLSGISGQFCAKLLKNNILPTRAGNLGLYLNLQYNPFPKYPAKTYGRFDAYDANVYVAIGTYFNFNKYLH